MMVAWTLYYFFPEVIRSAGTTNYGAFIYPPRQVSTETLQKLTGEKLADNYFQNKWTYVYIDSSNCDNICKNNLYITRQVHIAQGPEMPRVQRLFVLTDLTDKQTLDTFLVDYPNLDVATVDSTHLAKFRQPFYSTDDAELPRQSIFLVDGRGQVMMYYTPQLEDINKEATGMRRDLKKLLKDSKSG